MEEEKRSAEKLIELIRSQPNPEEYAEKIFIKVERMNAEETVLKSNVMVHQIQKSQ